MAGIAVPVGPELGDVDQRVLVVGEVERGVDVRVLQVI